MKYERELKARVEALDTLLRAILDGKPIQNKRTGDRLNRQQAENLLYNITTNSTLLYGVAPEPKTIFVNEWPTTAVAYESDSAAFHAACSTPSECLPLRTAVKYREVVE